MYSCRILADSVNVCGDRLTTFEVTFPRIVLAEFNTHRKFSRNSASSRAIPVEKQIEKVMKDPFIPIYWGKNQKGMQAEQAFDGSEEDWLHDTWIEARDQAVGKATELMKAGCHKQITNRLLEPFMWHTVIVTATEYENFFGLRCNKMAQPEIQKIATMMEEQYRQSAPILKYPGEWHLPLIHDEDYQHNGEDHLIMVSAGRCARVSYLTHDGKRDLKADVELCSNLIKNGHMSPLEHPAEALENSEEIGNFTGWKQYRKMIDGEAIFRRTE